MSIKIRVLQFKRGLLARLTAAGILPGEPAIVWDDDTKPRLLIGDRMGVPRELAAPAHVHLISSITGLQAALDAKAWGGGGIAWSQLTDIPGVAAFTNDAGYLTGITDVMVTAALGFTPAHAVHGHTIADVDGLQLTLDGKAATGHGHAIADVAGLQADLDAKAAAVHSHAVADTTGLQASLDAKAAVVHAHSIMDVTNLQTTLDAITAGSGIGSAPSVIKIIPPIGMPLANAKGASTGVAVTSTRMLVIGGGTAALDVQGYEFDLSTGLWTQTGPLPMDNNYGAGLVRANDGYIYFIGSNSRVFRYDPSTMTWVNLCAAPAIAINSGINAVQLTTGPYAGRIMIVQNNALPVYLFDPSTLTFASSLIANAPVANVSFHLVMTRDGRVWRVGGTYYAGLHVYDPVANTWTAKANLPQTTWNAGSVIAANGDILLMGGYPNRNMVTRYRVATDTWDAGVNCIQSAREAFAIAQLTSTTYALACGTSSPGSIEFLGSN